MVKNIVRALLMGGVIGRRYELGARLARRSAKREGGGSGLGARRSSGRRPRFRRSTATVSSARRTRAGVQRRRQPGGVVSREERAVLRQARRGEVDGGALHRHRRRVRTQQAAAVVGDTVFSRAADSHVWAGLRHSSRWRALRGHAADAVARRQNSRGTQLVLLFNFFDELRRLAPSTDPH